MPFVDADILYPALRLARITGGPGRTASPDQINDGFQALNRLIDGWTTLRGLIYSMQRNVYTLSPPKQVYTIGRGGGADFHADRPTRIDHANAVISTGGASVNLPINILTADEWSQMRVREVLTTFPTAMYPDYSHPNCNLYMWPIPTSSPGLELWTWQQTRQFSFSDDPILAPPGYLNAMVLNLAVTLADQFGTQISPNIYGDARKALAMVKGLNTPSPEVASADVGTTGRKKGDFNYQTGMPS